MLAFASDYMMGAHPEILARLIQTNGHAHPGYGSDEYCKQAKAKIRRACGCEDANIYFLMGGTQTNQVAIDSVLQAHEGVVAATTGHINVHEAGAIEGTGHKVLTLPGHEGKIDACELQTYMKRFYQDESHEHMVFPGMVYLSHPTEYGTLYTKSELNALAMVCRDYQISLYLDGARLGYGLMSRQTDVTLKDIAQICDIFSIGGTKVGALFGEALVFTRHAAPKHLITLMKKQGALLAKGWLLGLQFDTLFTNDLYATISRHAIDMAERLKKMLQDKGYTFYVDSPTNQQFIVLENAKLEQLKAKVNVGFWEKLDDQHTVIRLATSWATKEEDLQALEALL